MLHKGVLAIKAGLVNAFFVFLAVHPAQAQQTGDDVMSRVHQVLDHFPSVVAEVDMRLITNGSERARQLRLMTQVEGDRKQIIATFRAPKDVADVGYATDIDMKTGNQESWVYFPSIGKVTPIKSAINPIVFSVRISVMAILQVAGSVRTAMNWLMRAQLILLSPRHPKRPMPLIRVLCIKLPRAILPSVRYSISTDRGAS